MRKSRIACLLLLIYVYTGAYPQSKVTLSGVVKDSKSEAIIGATVAVKGAPIGASTDDKGHYVLSVNRGKYVLNVSMLGYKSQEYELNLQNDSVINFILKEDTVSLASVTVYGKSKTQELRERAYAVNAVNIKPLINTTQNLSTIINKTTGVHVREEGGLGSDFDLSVNGMSGNSIRYFLDGIPLDAKGAGVTLANLPLNIIDRVEIYKGVIPAYLGSDALGGAINIITSREKKNFWDVSYGIGSFNTHKFDLNAQYVMPKSGIIVKPVVSINYAKNNYLMKDVEVPNADKTDFITMDCPRFHDDYLSMYGQLETGVTDRSWADAFFISASISKIDRELQTGSVQSKVIGMAERRTESINVSARYTLSDFLLKDLLLNASFSHTWDHSETVDTVYRKYYWDGSYIESSRNEINGRGRTWRHYKRPLTIVRFNLDYQWNNNHSFNFNYLLNRTGNKQSDKVDDTFEPSNDVLSKHILGLSCNQSFLDGRWDNTFFLKNYINHLKVEQTEFSFITGSDEVASSSTQSHWGYGIGSRYMLSEKFALKTSYEHSVRLPLSRELLGNGTTVYANMTLRPESSQNFNLGIFGTWCPALAHTFFYEMNGFIRLVDDYIQATVSEKEGMIQYVNVPAVHIKGVEGEVKYDWDNKLQLMVNASYQDSRDQRKYKDDGKLSATYRNRTPNKPWFFCNAEAAYTFQHVGHPTGKLRLGYDYQWVHWFYLTWEAYGANATKARIPTQNLSNISVLYSWKNGRYNLSMGCNNLFDVKTYDNYKLQKPGRSFSVKFRLFIINSNKV